MNKMTIQLCSVRFVSKAGNAVNNVLPATTHIRMRRKGRLSTSTTDRVSSSSNSNLINCPSPAKAIRVGRKEITPITAIN
mmetsp:Transcript_7716/g.19866  ORF Transcript_7716/g.19866 Transcript_7716/m.19866 type:complete len:80 (+) Transcript_7716:262-501(+)